MNPMPVNADLAADISAPPPFPLWPFACLAYAEQCSRDYAAYYQRVAKARDPAEVVQAEGELGRNLVDDLNQAFFDMVLAPWGLVTQGRASPGKPRAVH